MLWPSSKVQFTKCSEPGHCEELHDALEISRIVSSRPYRGWNCPELLTVHLTIFLHYRQSKLCNHWQELIIMARNRAIKYAVWYKVSANVIVWNVRLTRHTFPSYFYRLWLSRITQWDVKVLQSPRRITATDLWSQERSVEWRSGDSNS